LELESICPISLPRAHLTVRSFPRSHFAIMSYDSSS
jgi:hypothetical protein